MAFSISIDFAKQVVLLEDWLPCGPLLHDYFVVERVCFDSLKVATFDGRVKS